MSEPLNTDPTQPWNNPMEKDNPFAPHNGFDGDNPLKPWNNPCGKKEDLTDRERRDYHLSERYDNNEYF